MVVGPFQCLDFFFPMEGRVRGFVMVGKKSERAEDEVYVLL